MDGNPQHLQLFHSVENDFFPFSSFQSAFPSNPPEQIFTQSLPGETVENKQDASVRKELVSVLSRNDSLSDDSHFDQTVIGSNENSIQPSPPTANASASTPPKMQWIPPGYSTQPVNSQKLGALSSRIETPEPNDANNQRELDADLSEFINNFLGSDELMENVPPVTAAAPLISQAGLRLPHQNILSDTRPEQASVQTAIEPGNPQQLRFSLAGSAANANQLADPLKPNKKATSVVLVSTNTSREQPPTRAPARRTERRKPRTYSQAVPSQHCHICSRRPTEGSPHQVCGNLQRGRCRKTICTKCFHQFRWDLKAAREAPVGTWECPHCRGQCPQRAQCVIYNRTSDRRRLKLINHRKRKKENEKEAASTGEPAKKKQAGQRDDSPGSGKTSTEVMTTAKGDDCNGQTGKEKKSKAAAKSKKKATEGKSGGATGKKEQVATVPQKLGNEGGVGNCTNTGKQENGSTFGTREGPKLDFGNETAGEQFFLDANMGGVATGIWENGVSQVEGPGGISYPIADVRQNSEPIEWKSVKEVAEQTAHGFLGEGSKQMAVGREEDQKGNAEGISGVYHEGLVSAIAENGEAGKDNTGGVFDPGNICIEDLWPTEFPNDIRGGDDSWILGESGLDAEEGERDSLIDMMERVAN